MEPGYWDSNPNKVPPRIFPPEFHFQPLAINKTQKFYEFILVDSDSISIKHFKDQSRDNRLTQMLSNDPFVSYL
jgi:hypothetical protein